MEISASKKAIENVLEDFAKYSEIFPDIKQVKVQSQQGRHWLTAWEQRIPIFFIPNVHFEFLYDVDKDRSHRSTYHYRLHRSGQVLFNDGLIILESLRVRLLRGGLGPTP